MGSQEHRTPLATTSPTEPKWNASMQFLVKDLGEDVLCINVLDKGHYSPDGNDGIILLMIIFLNNTFMYDPPDIEKS